MKQQRAALLSLDASFLENSCEYPHKLYIARNNNRVSKLRLPLIVQVYLYLYLFYTIVFESQGKKFQTYRGKTEFNVK